ncbi:MAG: serine hydrolase [Chloroflexi bacterium]|nr:serine hydrolase [Chloroflexota bacterium]
MTQLQATGSMGLSQERLDRVYHFLDEAVQTGKIPGAAIQLARHGVAVAPRSFGRLGLTPDSPPMPPDAIFLTASVTKPVTVTAVMLLVERGKLLLDYPVCSIIPEFGANGKDQVTVRHLMTHTSGLPDMLPTDRSLRSQHAPLAEFVRQICALPLDFPAGANLQYQSCGTAMLGAIIERIEGVSLPAFLQREIFGPLGMVDTALGAQNLPAARIAQVNIDAEMQGKDWGWNRPYWQHFGAPWGGMLATVRDMGRFCQLFLNGGELDGVRILSPATVQAMTTDQTAAMPALPELVRMSQSWGLGWRRQSTIGWSYLGNLTAPGAYGHGGATGTVVWMDPARALSCVLFTTQPAATSEGLLGRCSNLVAAAAI